jgi:hypothetical protein
MRFSNFAAGTLAASTMVLAGSMARAEGPTTFGKSGELAVSWDQPLVAGALASTDAQANTFLPLPMALTPLGFQYYSATNNQGSGTVFAIAPAGDYFVIDNLSIGAQVMVGVVTTSPSMGKGTTTTLYGIAPQIGYNLALTDSISFWPKVFFAYAGASQSDNGLSQNAGTIGAFAPFLFHIATHFYVGVGPNVSTQAFVNQSQGTMNNPNPTKITTFGAMATFGGWFSFGGG